MLPVTPTYLIVQERHGVARCLEFSRIPGSDRLKLSVRVFDSECFEQNRMSQSALTFQGACQEALTDATSVSGSGKRNPELRTLATLLAALVLARRRAL
jgi:hypothetical protein